MATLTVNGSTTYQTMNGVGSNVHSWSWKNGELTPALDLLVGALGHNIFRVVKDRMEWAGTGSTRTSAIATRLTNLAALDSATLQTVYETSDFQSLWSTIAYLNDKGFTGNQILLSFMGWTAAWMGGSGAYGSVSTITNNTQTNQDIATMLASCVYYGHHRRDVSGANVNLSFSYLDPFNECDWNGLEGPQIGTTQLNTIYTNIIATLNGMGDTTTMIAGPATAQSPDSYTAVFTAGVRARMGHFSWHSYGGSAVPLATARSGTLGDWMTETSIWISGADDNQSLPADQEWSTGVGIGDIFLGDLANGYTAVMVWEAFDTWYYHHNSYSAWGHIGCTQNGSGCTTSDTYTRTYAARRRSWPLATVALAARPGMQRIGVTENLSGTILAFRHPTTGALRIVGHNTGSAATIIGTLSNVGTVPSLSLYVTTSTTNLTKIADVAVTGGTFTTPSLASDSFFYLAYDSGTPPVGTPVLSVR